MVDLTTTYMGIPLKNPIIVAGGPTTQSVEMCAKAAQAGWAAIVTKTYFAPEVVRRKITNVMYRPAFALLSADGRARWKAQVPKLAGPRYGNKLGRTSPDYALALNPRGTTFQTWPDDQSYLDFLNRAKESLEGTGCKLIASIYAYTEEGWEQLCDLVNRSDADGVELNLGCPVTGGLWPETGEYFPQAPGHYPELVALWARTCAQRLRVPASVKLPGHSPDPLRSVKAIQESGCRGTQYADTRIVPDPTLFIDLDTATPAVFPDYPLFRGGIPSASWSLPFIMGRVAQFRLEGVSTDISGCGGVQSGLDVLRLMMAGATSAQACTATLVEGVGIARQWLEEITGWMESRGHHSLRELQGVALRQLTTDASRLPAGEVPQVMGGPLPRQQVRVNEKRCITCRWCQEACPYLAIDIPDRVPHIDQRRCEVCGMCVALCPMRALAIAPRG